MLPTNTVLHHESGYIEKTILFKYESRPLIEFDFIQLGCIYGSQHDLFWNFRQGLVFLPST